MPIKNSNPPMLLTSQNFAKSIFLTPLPTFKNLFDLSIIILLKLPFNFIVTPLIPPSLIRIFEPIPIINIGIFIGNKLRKNFSDIML